MVDLSHIPSDVLGLVPRETAVRHRLVPVELSGNDLLVAAVGQLSESALGNLSSLSGHDIKVLPTTEEELDAALAKHYGIGANASHQGTRMCIACGRMRPETEAACPACGGSRFSEERREERPVEPPAERSQEEAVASLSRALVLHLAGKGTDPRGNAAAMARIANGAGKVVVELRQESPVLLDLPFLMVTPSGPVHLSCRVLPGGIVEDSGPPAATPAPDPPPEAAPTVLGPTPGPHAEAGMELPRDPKHSGSLPSRGAILGWVIGTAIAILLVLALPVDATFAVFMGLFIGLHLVVLAGVFYGHDRWIHGGLDLFQRRRILRGGVEAEATVLSERLAERRGVVKHRTEMSIVYEVHAPDGTLFRAKGIEVFSSLEWVGHPTREGNRVRLRYDPATRSTVLLRRNPHAVMEARRRAERLAEERILSHSQGADR